MRRRLWFVVSLAALLSGCAMLQGVPLAAKEALAPSGSLRAAINFGNPILASRRGGEVSGVSVDLSRELASRLNVAIEFVTYESAGAGGVRGAQRRLGRRFRGHRPGARARHAAERTPT